MDRCNEALPALKWKGAWAVEGAMRGRGRGGACQRLGKAIGTLLHWAGHVRRQWESEVVDLRIPCNGSDVCKETFMHINEVNLQKWGYVTVFSII